MYKILIVEDDPTISSHLQKQLATWGYSTFEVTDFSSVYDEFKHIEPDLVLMDITLPFFNGFHWCTMIRQDSNVPIMFISSASDNMNIVMAMNMGADDFIVKPFDLNVLVAKIQAVLRRSYASSDTNSLEYNGAVLNINDATLLYESQKIELTKNEYKILTILLENKGKIVSRDDIMQHLWETDEFIDDNTLTVNMTRLKRKLEEYNLNDFIKTKKGIGYIIG